MLKKKRSNLTLARVPSLNFEPGSRKFRSLSDAQTIVKRDSAGNLILEYHKIDESIKEVKKILNEMKTCIIRDDTDIGQDITSIKMDVHNILTSSERSPRMLSKFDAVVANSQLLLSHFDDKTDALSENIVNRDSVIVDTLIDLSRSVEDLNTKVNMVSEKISSIEKVIGASEKE
uniref:Uncharacterized protein n=1 Tax=Marseillevirus LCMAC101 TaxID=2506602 RepID=A0A481YTK6_9VIRU|nr:MAG: hypothetical protein LCMAC101_04290 [Marseillevirus LCMAC101]